MIFLAALCVLAVSLSMFKRKKLATSDELTQAYLLLCRKLEKLARPRERSETPLQYAQHISRVLPEHGTMICQLTRRFCDLQYKPPTTDRDQAIAAFKEAVLRSQL